MLKMGIGFLVYHKKHWKVYRYYTPNFFKAIKKLRKDLRTERAEEDAVDY